MLHLYKSLGVIFMINKISRPEFFKTRVIKGMCGMKISTIISYHVVQSADMLHVVKNIISVNYNFSLIFQHFKILVFHCLET